MDQIDISVPSVLVVEDNPGDARLVEIFLLEEPGRHFTILKAETLAQALAVLVARPVDVVLLDLSLPDSFGLDTLARLRAAHPRVPVVVLTGTNDEDLALRALRSGAQDYLVKGHGDGELMRRSVRYAIERSVADQALRDTEGRFRAVFENAGIGVVLARPDGTFAEANPAFCDMLGYGLEEVLTLSFSDITHPDDLTENVRLRTEMRSGQRDEFDLTKRYLAKDGRVIWAKLNVSAIRHDSTDLAFTVAVIEDITERKRLEDHMRLAATVFENTGEGLFVTDAETRIMHVNPAFTDICGYAPEEVIGHTPRMLSSGRHEPEFYERMWQALNTTGRWQGEIWDRHKSGEMFASWANIAAVRDGTGRLTNYACVFSDITSRKQIEERLSYQANHDPLTKLPNRTLFHERLNRALARAQRNQTMVALLFIDLDKFKQVNDTLGHLAGDQLLQEVASRLTNCVRQGDTVARLAGDEFTVILEDVQDPRDAAIVSHKILNVMVQPFDLGGHEARISSSIGVALYPSDETGTEALIQLADTAMYRAKSMGRNCCHFHSEAVSAQAFERLELEKALRRALEQQQFQLYYQPIFDLPTGQMVAVEALLRWQHPEVGMVTPTQFLALADETGLIVPIGRWAMAKACADVQALRQSGADNLCLHMNVSGRQLRQPDLVESVAGALEASGLPAQALVVEVHEAVVVDKGQVLASDVFNRFSALGVILAIDEFGAGLSSFSFLHRLPVAAIKVTQPFVRNVADSEDDAEIVSAIVAMARGLHMKVVAPGIETAAQLDAMASFGCTRVQGFHLARPMTIEELRDYLAKGEPPTALAERTRQ